MVEPGPLIAPEDGVGFVGFEGIQMSPDNDAELLEVLGAAQVTPQPSPDQEGNRMDTSPSESRDSRSRSPVGGRDGPVGPLGAEGAPQDPVPAREGLGPEVGEGL